LAYLKWQKEWSGTDILRDMTYLEIIPIGLAIFLWFDRFQLKNILFYSDNLAVVSILNSKYCKSESDVYVETYSLLLFNRKFPV
jgi:hypothetical protein